MAGVARRQETKESLYNDLPASRVLSTILSTIVDDCPSLPELAQGPKKLCKWRERAKLVAYVDLFFFGVYLAALAISFLYAGAASLIVKLGLTLMGAREEEGKWQWWTWSKRSSLVHEINHNMQSAWASLWMIWVGSGIFFIITVVRLYAALKLIRSTEMETTLGPLGKKETALEALVQASVWKKVAIMMLILDGILTYVARHFVVAAVLQMISFGVVLEYMKELKKSVVGQVRNKAFVSKPPSNTRMDLIMEDLEE